MIQLRAIRLIICTNKILYLGYYFLIENSPLSYCDIRGPGFLVKSALVLACRRKPLPEGNQVKTMMVLLVNAGFVLMGCCFTDSCHPL